MLSGAGGRGSFLRGPLAGVTLRAADLARGAALRNYAMFLRSADSPPGPLMALSPLAAWRAAEHARRRVPAYRQFLARAGWRDDPTLSAAERIGRLPVADKESYIKAFSTEQRCLDGRIPMIGTEIDESSGSSGTPYNWVRGAAELADKHREMSQFARYSCGSDVITINAFSMGAWATGVNVGEAMLNNGPVKSTGPDVEKILHTLRFFGPRYSYLITGYPPFLKHLLDASEEQGFDWSRYRTFGIAAGEGMSEGLRDYLERRFRAVWSGYGASDLDIGVAGELPLTVWIRKRVAADPRLQQALFRDTFLLGKSRLRDACLIIMGVQRQLQGQGIMRILQAELARALRRRGYERLTVTWIADVNQKSSATVAALGARPLHRLTLYEGAISTDGVAPA